MNTERIVRIFAGSLVLPLESILRRLGVRSCARGA